MTVEQTSPPFSEHLNQSAGSFELVLSAVIFGLFGLWLDSKFGITPWLTITFTVLGFIGACASMYYRYKHRISLLNEAGEVPSK
jgi:F0F1-type ATP synthase assembly protein I